MANCSRLPLLEDLEGTNSQTLAATAPPSTGAAVYRLHQATPQIKSTCPCYNSKSLPVR